MSYTTSREKQGIKRGLKMGLEQGRLVGREEGLEQGREQGLRSGLEVAARRLFGERAHRLLEQLIDCDLPRLERLQERLAAGADLDELERVADQ